MSSTNRGQPLRMFYQFSCLRNRWKCCCAPAAFIFSMFSDPLLYVLSPAKSNLLRLISDLKYWEFFFCTRSRHEVFFRFFLCQNLFTLTVIFLTWKLKNVFYKFFFLLSLRSNYSFIYDSKYFEDILNKVSNNQ